MGLHTPMGFFIVVLAILTALLLSPFLSKFTGSKGLV